MKYETDISEVQIRKNLVLFEQNCDKFDQTSGHILADI